jgi:hypothetical protein
VSFLLCLLFFPLFEVVIFISSSYFFFGFSSFSPIFRSIITAKPHNIQKARSRHFEPFYRYPVNTEAQQALSSNYGFRFCSRRKDGDHFTENCFMQVVWQDFLYLPELLARAGLLS